MNASIVVRSQGPAHEYFLTIIGAFKRALADAERLGCDPPSLQNFIDVIEEGRAFRLISNTSVIDFRAAPLGD